MCCRRHRHFAIAHSEHRISENEERQPRVLLRPDQVVILANEGLLGMAVHIPFNDCPCQIPEDVGGTGQKVIVPVGARIDFENPAIARSNPFVRLHAGIHICGVVAFKHPGRDFQLASALLLEIESDHLLDRGTIVSGSGERASAKSAVLGQVLEKRSGQLGTSARLALNHRVGVHSLAPVFNLRTETSLAECVGPFAGSCSKTAKTFELKNRIAVGTQKLSGLHLRPTRRPVGNFVKEELPPGSGTQRPRTAEPLVNSRSCFFPSKATPAAPSIGCAEFGWVWIAGSNKRDRAGSDPLLDQTFPYRNERGTAQTGAFVEHQETGAALPSPANPSSLWVCQSYLAIIRMTGGPDGDSRCRRTLRARRCRGDRAQHRSDAANSHHGHRPGMWFGSNRICKIFRVKRVVSESLRTRYSQTPGKMLGGGFELTAQFRPIERSPGD